MAVRQCPAPAAWHGGPEPWPPPNPPATAERLDELARNIHSDETFHPIAGFVDGKLAGATAALSLEVTVPGPQFVPMAGVTATGVIANHRRRGVLRQMVQAMFDAGLERNEPLSMLSASEGGIYGRFGFSTATRRTRWEIERAQAKFHSAAPVSGSLDLVDAATAREAWPQVHEPSGRRESAPPRLVTANGAG
ncbi:MAG: GNAT family N-acetyltransferase [Ilumatobacter sp.]